jgi:hypothetical protein
MANHNCEQAGYHLGTAQYADCRMELAPPGRRQRCRDAGLLSTPAGLVLAAAKPEQAPLRARIIGYTSIVCWCQQERRSTASTSLWQRTLEGCFCWRDRGIKLFAEGSGGSIASQYMRLAPDTLRDIFDAAARTTEKKALDGNQRWLSAPSAPSDSHQGPVGKQSAARCPPPGRGHIRCPAAGECQAVTSPRRPSSRRRVLTWIALQFRYVQ